MYILLRIVKVVIHRVLMNCGYVKFLMYNPILNSTFSTKYHKLKYYSNVVFFHKFRI